jgi:putative peptidoglycan lipid II flippase
MGPEQWWLVAGSAGRAAALAGLVLLGAAVYFGALWLLGFRTRDFVLRSPGP